jgi:hypothetical protein
MAASALRLWDDPTTRDRKVARATWDEKTGYSIGVERRSRRAGIFGDGKRSWVWLLKCAVRVYLPQAVPRGRCVSVGMTETKQGRTHLAAWKQPSVAKNDL